MKLIANRFIQWDDGELISLAEFKGIHVKYSQDESDRKPYKARFLTAEPFVLNCGTAEERFSYLNEFNELLEEAYGSSNQDPLAPPKGYIDITRETSDGKSYRTVLKISDVTRVVEGKPYTDIAVGDKIFHAKEDYDTVMSRMKED